MDLYRSILRIADARKAIFQDVGGSEVVLSPAGSKAHSIGAMMAAMERDFPVMYVESVGYRLEEEIIDNKNDSSDQVLLHLWLSGNV